MGAVYVEYYHRMFFNRQTHTGSYAYGYDGGRLLAKCLCDAVE